jgi:Holliday junction resolvase RusA-like endonuclease
MKFRISLPCPLNRRFMPIAFTKKHPGGKSFTGARQVLSKEYRSKQQRLVAEVWKQTGGFPPAAITGNVQVCMVMTPRDKRTADIDAYAKAILDGLVKANVLKDDSQVVHTICERLPNAEHPGHIDVTVEEIGQ